MQTDFLQYIFQAINTLLTQNLGFFDSMGQNLFRSFATILVAWFGVKSALASASGRPPSSSIILPACSSPSALASQWSTTTALRFRVWESSFHNLVTNEAQFLSSQIDQAAAANVISQVADFESRMDSPSWGDLFGTAIYVIVTILLAAAQAIAFVVIAYGFIATAVCVLVGPVFVPFFIVPKMEWLFWGWFRCFLQYAFYQVIAAAVVYVIRNLMLGALRLPPAGTLSTVQLIGWFPVLFITFLASIYVLLKIPSLANHIFSGTAGGSSAGLLDAPAAVLNRVM